MTTGRSDSSDDQPDAGAVNYDQAKALAGDRDADVRCRLAARTDIAPEILYYLAGDADAGVRRAVAHNLATPRQADVVLARDPDDEVRLQLARKIGRLVPGLSASDRGILYRLTVEALELLAADALPHVRRVIAEEIKALECVPPSVVRKLARDVEVMVAAPVLEYSPLLSDDDLLEIIHSAPVRGALAAISRRRGLAAALCEAIAETGDAESIAELLGNPSAQIREETLDKLVERAQAHPQWHRPLLARPQLSARAARRMMQLVSDSLLAELERGERLAPAVSAALRQRVETRLEAGASPHDAAERRGRAAERCDEHDEAAIGALIRQGEVDHLVHTLARRAALPGLTVRRVLHSGDAVAVVALAWKAGLEMATAEALQRRVAKIPRARLIASAPCGAWPLDAQELERRLAAFT